MPKGDWGDVNWSEVLGVAAMSMTVGVIKLLYLVRRGRRFKWFDVILEPMLALLGGLTVWAIAEVAGSPDLVQATLTSLGAWGGSKTIHTLEVKYLGGSRVDDRKEK